ncbi:MAG: valine--tRNA ligase, partial [Candidatus Aminicenantes bacterium]
WMYNIHDWCISRQLWWGHRIPAWYCRDCGRIMVAMEAPAKCDKCGGALDQDEDVLDTWFSSALWPFGTLGWPDETEDLRTFYPTDLMSTGFDIIFFWVARMIMMGLKFRGEIPFKQVFINGLVRDLKRRKMSKSEGNIIDPLEMIDKYGTDALRFTLAALAVPGMDLALSEERMAGYQAFANKIWNASRFVLMNLKSGHPEVRDADLGLADRWIRSRMSAVTAALDASLGQYKFYEAADLIYHFVWHEFCDWYIEFAKVGLREGNATTEAVLADALDRILKLLHPFMPFITEEIWHQLPGAGPSISVAPFPIPEKGWSDEAAEKAMALVQAVIVETRMIRTENKIAPKDKLRLIVKRAGLEETAALEAQAASVRTLAGLAGLEFVPALPEGEGLLKGVAGPFEIGVVPGQPADPGQERDRLQKELAKLDAETGKVERKLSNADFVAKAPAAVVAENRARLEELKARREKVGRNLAALADPS